MTLPRQVRVLSHPAQAPYNFVPLPETVYIPSTTVPEDQSSYLADRYSGEISISLTTETWLYTRAGVRAAYAADYLDMNDAIRRDPASPYREFAHHGDVEEPVIPGSSFRGMIRNLVTILSDGHLETSLTRNFCYRAVGDVNRRGLHYRQQFGGENAHPNPGDPLGLPQDLQYPLDSVRGGYLFRDGGQWFIQPAVKHQGESFIRYDKRQGGLLPVVNKCRQVWVKPERRVPHEHRPPPNELILHYAMAMVAPASRSPADTAPPPSVPGGVKGMLVRTGAVGKKHLHCIIYEPQGTWASRLPIPDEVRDLYLEDIDTKRVPRDPQKPGRPLEKPGRPQAESIIPPWNDKKGPCPETAPCFYMMDGTTLVFFGGTLFFRLPYEYAPADYVPCPPSYDPDLATRLFGAVYGKHRAFRGRVRFEDLLLDRQSVQGSPFEDYRSLNAPLLAPKPACIQHYLVQPSASKEELRHYDDEPFDPARPNAHETTVLRGFKQYWHRWSLDPRDPSRVARDASGPPAPDDTHTVIRPVRQGVGFHGCVHFDNLTRIELGALLVALRLRPHLRHKLGMARPLGYGSVRVTCDTVRILDPATRYGRLFAAGAPAVTAPAGTSALDAGWRADSQQIADAAIVVFARALGAHRDHQPALAENASVDAALASFWSHERMQELEALLEWDQAPDPETTRQVHVDHKEDHNVDPNVDPSPPHESKARQWEPKNRWILPPPTVVRPSRAPQVPQVTPPGPPVVTGTPLMTSRGEQVWPGVTLGYDPATRTVSARSNNDSASTRLYDAPSLLDGLTAEQSERLMKSKKKQLLNVTVTVKHLGQSKWQITGVAV